MENFSMNSIKKGESLKETMNEMCDDSLQTLQMLTLEKVINETRSEMNNLSSRIGNLKLKFNEMVVLMEEMAEELMQLKSFNETLLERNLLPPKELTMNKSGLLIWGIDHFSNNVEDARTNHNVLHSQSFLTREYGYHFQVAAYLNGIGQWENKFILLSIDLHPTPWDVILYWPCRVNIILTLIDQKNDRSKAKDETKQFKKVIMGKHRKSFKTFISKETLKENHYLLNDSILIIIKVTEDE